jgi:RNA polymerase sigma-70 factor (ECF subfamily)
MSALAGVEPPPEPAVLRGVLDGHARVAGSVADINLGETHYAVTEPVAELPLLETLVGAAVGGDPIARERLLAEIHPLVLRYCRARLGRQEPVSGSAEDVAQEICLAVVNALPNYRLRGLSFRAFVYGIAAHKVTDAFRSIGRNRAEPMADLPDVQVVHDGPEQRLILGELTERLGALLHRLTPRQREVLVLRIAVGLSAEETATAVGSTPGAVRVTQHRALNRLRRIVIGTAGPDDEPEEG